MCHVLRIAQGLKLTGISDLLTFRARFLLILLSEDASEHEDKMRIKVRLEISEIAFHLS